MNDFWFSIVIIGLFLAFILWLEMDDSGEGALVIDGQEVCVGEMDFRGVKTRFECDDGRIIYNPTNYQIKKKRKLK